MSEKVEIVARAIFEATEKHTHDTFPGRYARRSWDEVAGDPRNGAFVVARAAMEAMRPLPNSYFSVLVRTFNMRDDEEHREAARRWYDAMIDVALK